MLAYYLKPEERFGLNEVYKFGILNIVQKRFHIYSVGFSVQRQAVGRTKDADAIIYDRFLCFLVNFGIVLTQKQDKYNSIFNKISGQMG